MAPIAYEVARSFYARLDDGFDAAAIDALRRDMRGEAEAVIRRAAAELPLRETWTADMRYRGQGHEITVAVPGGDFTAAAPAELARRFAAQYQMQFGRGIPGLEVEVMSWTCGSRRSICRRVSCISVRRRTPRSRASAGARCTSI